MSVFDNVMIHESSYVDHDVTIGPGTKIWHFSHILGNVQIGSDCSFGQNVVVGPNVIIGNGVRVQNNVSIYDGVNIEDDVFCGPSCVFTNVINPRAGIERKDEFRLTKVRKGASIGANATILCGNEIGKFSFIAAGATVTKSVPAYALVAGTPAKQIGWMSEHGGRLSEDLVCSISGEKYELSEENQLRKSE